MSDQATTTRPNGASNDLARLLSYAKPHWLTFTIGLLGFGLFSLGQVLLVLVLQEMVNAKQYDDLSHIRLIPFYFIGIFLLQGIGLYVGSMSLAKMATHVVYQLRNELCGKFLNMPASFYEKNHSGCLISGMTHDINTVAASCSESVRTIAREGFTIVGLLSFLFFSNWRLSLIFLIAMPIIILVVKHASRLLRNLSGKMRESESNLSRITSEIVAGHRSIRIYGGQPSEQRRFSKCCEESRDQSLKLASVVALHHPILQFVIAILLSIMVFAVLVLMKNADVGDFVGYLMAAILIQRPARRLSQANAEVQRGLASARSVFSILDAPESPDQGKHQTSRARGAIECVDLEFQYPGAATPALQGITFRIEPGQTVALVGPTGGGKSTILNALARFLPHQKGTILLDGVGINEYEGNNFYSHLSIVTQEPHLFHDTIANNIAYGMLAEKSRDQIIAAATDAHLMEFVDCLPQGLDTIVSEGGANLSAGQRQRITIARALLKDAPVLLLDEATSALDATSEALIQESLRKISSGRSTLIIAHRLSTIVNADQILFIDQGRIIERGTHSTLLQQQGAYAGLYASYANRAGSS